MQKGWKRTCHWTRTPLSNQVRVLNCKFVQKQTRRVRFIPIFPTFLFSTLSEKSFRESLLSRFFILHLLWLSLMQLRHYLFIGTLNTTLHRMTGGESTLGKWRHATNHQHVKCLLIVWCLACSETYCTFRQGSTTFNTQKAIWTQFPRDKQHWEPQIFFGVREAWALFVINIVHSSCARQDSKCLHVAGVTC